MAGEISDLMATSKRPDQAHIELLAILDIIKTK